MKSLTNNRNSDDVNTLLRNLGSKLTVNLLLENLQHAIEFETFVSRKYGVGVSRFAVHLPRLNNFQLQEVLDSTKSSSTRTISSAFEKYMGVFVDAQDKYVSSQSRCRQWCSLFTGPFRI
jgi:vacuolar protein sorting-associated protein 53